MQGIHHIKTYQGEWFPFVDGKVDPKVIDIRDIAHSLSHLCRFTGHTNLFYSVAQHCLLVSEKIPGGPEVKLAALLHDAAEAYVGDLSSPLKKWLDDMSFGGRSAYLELHDTILTAIWKKYKVQFEDLNDLLPYYDMGACYYEQQAFMGHPIEDPGRWEPWDPEKFAGDVGDRDMGQVEAEFLKRFEDLMAACGREHLV